MPVGRRRSPVASACSTRRSTSFGGLRRRKERPVHAYSRASSSSPASRRSSTIRSASLAFNDSLPCAATIATGSRSSTASRSNGYRPYRPRYCSAMPARYRSTPTSPKPGAYPTMSGSKKSCLPPFRYFTSQSAIRRRSFDVNASPSPHTARACASSRRSTRSPSEPDESSARNTAARNEASERLGRWRRASSPGSRPDGCRARAPCRPGAEPGRHVTAPARVEGPIPRRVCAARATRERPCRPWSVPTRRDPATAAT